MSNYQNATLHTLNKTAQDEVLNLRLSQIIMADDAVILIEDGVYQCLTLYKTRESEIDLSWSQISQRIFALKDDALARGIPTSIDGVIFISYEEFVQLSLQHTKVVSWY